ncbi:MAG: class I SAM-dependent methyltransferase [Gallionella sp.]
MNERCKQQWEALGACDPYWAVLTHPSSIGGKWDKEIFFQSGREEIDAVFNKVSGLGIQIKFDYALDYGCGVGRLSQALSRSFRRVLGVDISATMLSEARSENAGYDNISYLNNDGTSLEGVADEVVDFLYCNIVLQHSPKGIQKLLIREFCRVLRPGGTVMFQTPSHPRLDSIKGFLHLLLSNLVLNLARRFRYGKHRVMEMHTMAIDEVLKLLLEEGMTIYEAERYDSAGADFISYRYVATKK